MATNANFTLEEILTLTNDELTSNWSRLASLIKFYEGIPWDEARPKAIDLLRFGKAIDYIEQARALSSGKVGGTIPKKTIPVKPIKAIESKEPEKRKVKKIVPLIPKVKDVYQMNYVKLLQIVPDLEERILSGKEVYGKSKRSGFMDFNLELLHQDKTGYYIAISHYFIENGDMVADPDMELLVNLENKRVVPLAIQHRDSYSTTFADIYDRKLLNPKQIKQQNSFLSFWLGNLKKQGHKIKWKEPHGTGELKIEKSSKPPVEEIVVPPIVEVIEDKTESNQQAEMEEILKYWKRFASFIRKNEDISQELAEEKARKLKEEDKAWDYLEDAFNRKDKISNDALFRENYKTLIALIPDLRDHLRNEAMKGVLSGSKANLMRYEIAWAKDLNSTTSLISIFEMPEKQVNQLGILILAVNRIRKMVWIHLLDGNFFGMASFDDKEVLADSKARHTINKKLGRWLNLLFERNYKIGWEHFQEQKVTPIIEETQSKKQPDVNDEIPDFEVGKVQLTKAHLRAGITQEEIDWINENRQGLVITPRKNMTNTTRDFLMDSMIKAKRPGFRISKTGKLYYEGRSNRSDITDAGL